MRQSTLRKLAHGSPTPGVMYGRERPPTPLRTPGLLAPEAVTKISYPPDALRASHGAPVSWCSSVNGGCPSTRVGCGFRSFVRSLPCQTRLTRTATTDPRSLVDG